MGSPAPHRIRQPTGRAVQHPAGRWHSTLISRLGRGGHRRRLWCRRCIESFGLRDNSQRFRFGSGPNRRYVGELGTKAGSIRGETILPGGNSGVLGSPFYGNLLPRWLTNDTYDIRFKRGDVNKAADTKTVFVPAK